MAPPPTPTSPTSSSGTSNGDTALITVQEMTVEPKFAVSLPVCIPYYIRILLIQLHIIPITAETTALFRTICNTSHKPLCCMIFDNVIY
jgi:hypothetical protein